MEFFCNNKDRTSIINQSFVVCEFTCPGFGAYYLWKTDRTLYERCVKHAWNDQNSIVKNHLDQCVEVQHLLNITTKQTGNSSFFFWIWALYGAFCHNAVVESPLLFEIHLKKSAKFRALRAITSSRPSLIRVLRITTTCLTHLCTYAAMPSSIGAYALLSGLVLRCYNWNVRFVLCVCFN